MTNLRSKLDAIKHLHPDRRTLFEALVTAIEELQPEGGVMTTKKNDPLKEAQEIIKMIEACGDPPEDPLDEELPDAVEDEETEAGGSIRAKT